MTLGSEPKRRCHSEWLRTTTCAPDRSSSGTNVRPSSAGTPNKSKRFAETRRPSSRSGSPTPVRLKLRSDIAAIPVKTVFCLCQSRKLGGEGVFFGKPRCVAFSHIITSCSGFLKGSGRSRTALTTLKIAVFAPMPSAITTMAILANAGFFASVRSA